MNPPSEKHVARINEAIGKIVRDGRKSVPLRQVDLATELGIDQSALSRIEAGLQQLTAAQYFLFTCAVGIPDSLRGELTHSLRAQA